MSQHRTAILAAPSISAATSILTATISAHPGISGKSYRRLVRAVETRTAEIRSAASIKAAATRRRAKDDGNSTLVPVPTVVKPVAITKTRAKRRGLVTA